MIKKLLKSSYKWLRLESRFTYWRLTGLVHTRGVTLKFTGKEISDKVLRRIISNRYEVNESKLLLNVGSPNDNYLELGAGIGFMGSNIGRIISKGSGRMHLYEANPALIPLIRRNLKLNKCLDKATVHNEILVHQPVVPFVDFYVHKDFYSSSFVAFPDYIEKVQVSTKDINFVIKENDITFVVLDIEGGEYELFTDWKIPNSVKKVMLELHPAKTSLDVDVRQELLDQRFSVEGDNTFLYAYR